MSRRASTRDYLAHWPAPFKDAARALSPRPRNALGSVFIAAAGRPLTPDLVLEVAGEIRAKRTLVCYEQWLHLVIQALKACKVGLDTAPIALELARVRTEISAANAAKRPPKAAPYWQKVDHWPALYRDHFRARLKATAATLDDTLDALIAEDDDGGGPRAVKGSRLSVLENTHKVFNSFIKACDRAGLRQRISPQTFGAWLEAIAPTTSKRSLESQISVLSCLVQQVEPARDVSCMKYTGQVYRKEAKNEAAAPVVPDEPGDLAAKGYKLIKKAFRMLNDPKSSPQKAARAFRNGLVIVLLAFYPLRRRNMAPLELGVNVFLDGDAPRIEIPPAESKEANLLKFPLAPGIIVLIEEWLEYWLPFLNASETRYLFPATSRAGGPAIGVSQMAKIVKKLTGSNCHGFRHAAATALVEWVPEHASYGSEVLGHRSGRTLIIYSTAAEAFKASEIHADITAQVRHNLAVFNRANASKAGRERLARLAA